ncbi:MAG: amidohydrolase family protein [Gammaproteobacteria bacterium]|nr:amidohydrolase family protein [Gammaproteobacteria bacterium]
MTHASPPPRSSTDHRTGFARVPVRPFPASPGPARRSPARLGLVRRLLAPIALLTVVGPAACANDAPVYDIVLSGGRVMDPESGTDATLNVAITGDRIEAISEQPLTGTRVIDASGLVVAPGFVDLHQHGQTDETYRFMAHDGVTTGLELEVGTGDVAAFYAEREGGQPVNYGASIGHIPVRMRVMGDTGDFLPADAGKDDLATPEQIEEIAGRIREGLDQGAPAVGFGFPYTPAATDEELLAAMSVAGELGASAHVHTYGWPDGAQYVIDLAEQAGAPLHIVHANSTGGAATADFLAVVQEAVDAGGDVTTEAYPYGASQSRIESALYDDWEGWDDARFGVFQWGATGERLTRESFGRYREQGGSVISHVRTEEMTLTAVANPLTMVASDGGAQVSHPRSTGSFSKVLGKYVREDGVLTLMEALRKMTIEPARRLEAYVPMMANKGRIRVGADADVTVFDPETVRDRGDYTNAAVPSAGIEYVFVNGVLTIEDGEYLGTRAGRPVRR